MAARVTLAVAVVVLLLGLAVPGAASGQDRNRVRLSEVQTLTLSNGKMTTGRRSSPVPQMSCVGGGACHAHTPPRMQCYNRGFDGSDTQWECKADLPTEVRFGETIVVCEGYEYPDDPYVLRGSCGVEYTLEYTPGKNHHHQSGGGYGYNQHQQYGQPYNQRRSSSSSWAESLFTIVFMGFVLFIIVKSCCGRTRGAGGTAPGTGGGGFSGPGWGGGGGGGNGGNGGGGGPGCSPSPGAGGGYANFWTGLGLGGLLGTMYNRPRYGTGYGGYQRGWGGGGMGGRGFRSGGGGWGGGGGGFSGGSRSASGFGGTRRR